MKDPIPEYQLSSRRAISDAEMHKISDEPSKVFQDLSLSIRSEENPTIYTASVYPDEMSSVPKQSDSCDPSQPNDSTRSFGDTNPSLADTIYGSQDLHTIPQDLLSPNHHSSMSTGYGNEAAGYANASSYAPTSSPYYSMGYAPAPVRSTHALDASRGMIAMNQSSTILNIYGPRGVQQKSVDSNILTTALSVTSSSESSDISLPSYFGGSINSATDYSNADSDNESISSQNPSGMLTRSSPPAPVSMMGQFNSKISSSTQKKHKCKVCGKGFPRPSSLQTHMYYHTGEKPFACEVEGCRRQFSIISNLRRHRKVHKDEDSQDRDGDESDMDGQPPNTFTRHKNRSSVTQGHSKGSHISAEASSLTRESFGLRGLSTPHEKDEDMVSVGLMGKPVDPNYTHQDMACQTSNNWNPYPVFTNPWTNATVFPPMPSSSPFEKLQVSRPLGAGSLSSKSKEDPPVISKASTLSPTTKFDKMGELFKSESTKSSESKSFPTGTLVTSIPKPEPLDQEVSRMNLPKNSSVELEKESTVLRKERHVPVEEHVETPNAVSPETDGYQTTTESFSGESDVTGRSNSVYRELCSVTERNAGGRQELLVSSLDPMRQAVVDRVMEEFRMMFNQSWDADFRKCAGASTSPSNVQNGNGNFTSESSSALGPKKRRREDNESPDDKNGKNSRGPGGPRESAGPNSGFEGSTRFACPFRKHSTRLYTVYSHPICALSHWETISRVKEHLYRGHRIAVHCKRCWKIFKNQEQLDSHLTVATSDICDLQPGHPPEGITPEQERRLRSKKKTSPNQGEADRWKDIYKLLFPNEDIPSPYFEPLQEETAMSPDSRDLASYENYIRRELPRLVRSNIEEAVRREMQPLEASLINNLVGIIQDCQDRVFRSYRETQGISSEPQMQQSIDPEAPLSSMPPDGHQNRVGSNSRPLNPSSAPQSNFIDTIFETPPQSSESMLPAIAGIDFHSHLAMQPGDMFLSDSGYSSEQLQFCGCSGPCSCGITHGGEQEDNATREIEDDNLRWNDWGPHF